VSDDFDTVMEALGEFQDHYGRRLAVLERRVEHQGKILERMVARENARTAAAQANGNGSALSVTAIRSIASV
jgi:hypothetical protein